jgi:ammonium transporter Rh
LFGAYFGLALSFAARTRDYNHPTLDELQNSRYTSDLFSYLGTFILWVFWPSFNAYAVFEDARHRALINTYISMSASTVASLVTAAATGKNGKMNPVDLQNAVLSGGVVVGASADFVMQPFGAIVAGSIVGVIATLGYEFLQV